MRLCSARRCMPLRRASKAMDWTRTQADLLRGAPRAAPSAGAHASAGKAGKAGEVGEGGAEKIRTDMRAMWRGIYIAKGGRSLLLAAMQGNRMESSEPGTHGCIAGCCLGSHHQEAIREDRQCGVRRLLRGV